MFRLEISEILHPLLECFRLEVLEILLPLLEHFRLEILEILFPLLVLLFPLREIFFQFVDFFVNLPATEHADRKTGNWAGVD